MYSSKHFSRRLIDLDFDNQHPGIGSYFNPGFQYQCAVAAGSSETAGMPGNFHYDLKVWKEGKAGGTRLRKV
jgi:hypothetical protein